jgi:hypothetical protein
MKLRSVAMFSSFFDPMRQDLAALNLFHENCKT